jgi:hypothetical protein
MMPSTEAVAQRRLIWTDGLRILVLAIAVIAVTSPYLTARRVGGVDALWYANMIRGITDQIGAGHFPVPMGQGSFAWNGGVHPFRSAPVFLIVAALWNVITFGRLGPFALQHLALVTSALVGTIGFYVGAAKIMPSRRWASAGFAFFYLVAPSWLSVVTASEDYMSYMAFGAMPLVLYGNAMSVLDSQGRGYVPLGAGLALVWMCHPPIAFIASVVTLVIQTGVIVARGLAAWRGLAACGTVFAVLGAYYFMSMSEVPPTPDSAMMRGEIFTVLALALFFAGLGRVVLSNNRLGWAACALIGAVVVAATSRPWLIWILASTFFWIAAVATARWLLRVDIGRIGFVALFACGLLGAATAWAIIGPNYKGVATNALNFLSENTAMFAAYIRPLPTPFRSVGMFQLGWGLDAAFAVGVLSLFGRRPVEVKVFFAALLSLGMCFARVPLVSSFLVGYFPTNLAAMCGGPLDLRIMPVIASFSAMGGVLWLATLPAPGRGAPAVLAVIAVLGGWGGIQALEFVAEGHRSTSTDVQTEDSMRAENVALSRYAYDLMPFPHYYSNGVADPALETRLLDGSGNILVGPLQEERSLEGRDVRRVSLYCNPFPGSTWIDITPGITVAPHEHVLLRFEFDPDRSYNGFMMMVAEHGYREYHLPDSGEVKAFGIGGSRTPVLSLWNSGDQPEHYKLEMMREAGNDLRIDGGHFADLSVTKLVREALPIRLESLMPYRASVSSATGGWLESFVLYLPGFRGTVDGVQSSVVKSAEGLAEVSVPQGNHTVEIQFVGTPRLWLGAFVSGLGWCLLSLFWLAPRGRAPRPAPG